VTGYLRALFLATALAFAITAMSASPAARPATVDAASCVRIIGGVFNSPSNDNFMPYLNGEYVVLRELLLHVPIDDELPRHRLRDEAHVLFPTGYAFTPATT
jgi:hypothetical protein